MKIILKDRTFTIEDATLSAAIPDPYWSAKYNAAGNAGLSWFLDVNGKPEPGNDMWDVTMYHNHLHFPIRSWAEVVGQVVEWASVVDAKSNEPNGFFYVLEHEPIPWASLRFIERDGFKIRFEWTGVCDVFWDEDYGTNVPFTASGWAKFTGVRVLGSESDTEKTLLDRLAVHMAVCDFKQGQMLRDGHYNDGMGMASIEFTPIGWGSGCRPDSDVFDPSWLTSTVVALARQMYDSCDFSLMPVLSDALQDAGCDNENILTHCQQPEEHARGCWVLDLVLKK